MKIFARMDENNIVTRIHLVSDADASTEEAGIAFLKKIHNINHTVVMKEAWKDVSPNPRKKYPGPGDTWDEIQNAFIAPKPFPSWLSDDEGGWKPPVSHPYDIDIEDPKYYRWDESTTAWVDTGNLYP